MEKDMLMNASLRLVEGKILAKSELHDGTPFTITVGEHDVQLNEPLSKKEVDGFVRVVEMSCQDTRSYVRLPTPSITHGHNVLVNKFRLQPPNLKIEDFIEK